MPNLNECADKITRLAREKGFSNESKHAFDKLAYAMIELANAMDWLKKNSVADISHNGLTGSRQLDRVPNELIDAIFYSLHAIRILCPSADIDLLFNKKYEANMARQFQYGLSEERKGTYPARHKFFNALPSLLHAFCVVLRLFETVIGVRRLGPVLENL